MLCSQCGHDNTPDAHFCSSCGAPLAASGDDRTVSLVVAPSTGETVTVERPDLSSGGLLVVTRGPNSGSKYEVDQPVTTVGRHPDSDIFLDDVTVSRRHVELTRSGDQFTVRDVGSLNGTYLNRERIEQAPLSNSDELQVGTFRLLFLTAPVEG